MNALQEVIHSARELVNEHRHAYPPVWAKDANKIIDEAAAELAALRARVGELERDLESGFMHGAYARLKNLQEAERERDEYKRLTGGKTPQEFDEWLDRVLKNTEESAKQSSENLAKLQSISAALAKGAK